MGYGQKLNMAFAADLVAKKLREGWSFHTASRWALSIPPYAGNFSQEQFDQIIGRILNERRQAKRLAGSKNETGARRPEQKNMFPVYTGYPD